MIQTNEPDLLSEADFKCLQNLVQEKCGLYLECVLLAPGGRHMVIEQQADHHVVRIQDGPLVHRVRPSVDVLFHSMATQVGKQGIGVILTGMGADGAEGLLAMRQAGARTLAQDEASCVVFGMPKMAIKAGAAEQVLALSEISRRLLALVDADGSGGGG